MTPVKFERFRLIYPPRPQGSINPESLGLYRGFVAEYKFDDIRNLLYVFPDGHPELYNRYKASHRAYTLSEEMRKAVAALRLPRGSFHVFDGGLLQERLILWDVLVYRGSYLLGTTMMERYRLLERILKFPKQHENESGFKVAFKVSRNIWMAEVFRENFWQCYQEILNCDLVEGLILKNPNGKLERGLKEENNGSWQIRARKRHANYAF